MSLPEFGVKKPVTNLMIFSAIIVLAGYSIMRIGIDSMPKIEPPVISVISVYPGASPEDVEAKVSEPLENQLATTPGVEKITSRSGEGISSISLKFKWGTNLDAATNDVRDRLELAKRVLPDIPDEMDNPYIYKFNTANTPIIFMGITAQQSYLGLYDLIDKRAGDVLRQIPGVGTVQLIGGLERQINILIDRQRLEGYGFSITDIQDVLKQENIAQPLGKLKSGLTDYVMRLPGEFASPEEIKLVILGKRNGNTVYLKDVARIEDSFKEVTLNVRINSNRGVLLMVQKQTDTNTVEVARAIKKKIVEISPSLPPDVKMYTIFDTSQDIINSLNSLKSSVWLSITLVVLVVWFFLRQFLPSLIIALTIPFSLLISFIYLFLNGRTVNIISLSSLAIASGMVVDNAIVIVDNIYRKLERGNRPQEAAIFGAQEMFLSIGASTFTTIVVFLPMLFLPGVIGIMFGEMAVIITVTLLGSLFTSGTFSPMLCSKWMNINRGVKKRSAWFTKFYDLSERMFRSWEEFYSRCLGWCLRHKKIVIVGFTSVFIITMFMTRFVGNEFIPEEDTGDLRLTIHLPLGTRLEETNKVAQRIEGILKSDVPEARFYFSRTGEAGSSGRMYRQASGAHIVTGGAKLVSKTKRGRSDKEIGQALRNRIKQIPGVSKIDISTGNPIGRMITGTGGKAIQVEIIGNSFNETYAAADKIKNIMEKIPGAVDVAISREFNRPELKIEVDREKSASLGLSMNNIANSLKTYIQGSTATKYREKGDTYDIYVQAEEESRKNIDDIENMVIVSASTQKQVKLSNIARIIESYGPLEIERQNRERVVRVECNIYQRSSGEVIEDIKKELQKTTFSSELMINFGGEAEEQKKSFLDLALLLGLGIILVYMIMAAQFESLLDPFIIMFSIPFTFIGVILAFILTGTTLNIVSYLGIIMLMGIVVNNAIVLISYIIILRARGQSMYDAVTNAGKDRLRPVLMTTITTLVGLLPLAISKGEGAESWNPLGITMFGGLIVSTFITLLFVPTLYAVFHRKSIISGGYENA
ncbi:MAG: efflux RND transporter permease subunit [Candidatus Omnitrophota bacterium]|nr:efflux RND transporter permease subunit [Candidatus Omnitrophota bacterium]MBU1928663.1 efflux RND transporter permease subunit [Candidatus Omnitrophota bacterium]MBU2035772.1 efflux RND transporter permease subunit [Candidatus Omnitrophota bacterium]MBU2258193.1 efflux RND transporter permease subunit [Candidatus Omnitrophota bacterium]